jgi:MFS family permease
LAEPVVAPFTETAVSSDVDETALDSKAPAKRIHQQLAALLSEPLVCAVLLFNFASGLTLTGIELVYPLYLGNDLGVGPGGIGAVFGVCNIMFGSFCFIGGRLADKIGKRKVMAVGGLLACAATALLALPSNIYVAGGVMVRSVVTIV